MRNGAKDGAALKFNWEVRKRFTFGYRAIGERGLSVAKSCASMRDC